MRPLLFPFGPLQVQGRDSRAQDFHWGRELGWGSWGGEATPSHQLGGLGSAELPHRDSGPKGFPLFSAITMASADAIVLLTVDHKKK